MNDLEKKRLAELVADFALRTHTHSYLLEIVEGAASMPPGELRRLVRLVAEMDGADNPEDAELTDAIVSALRRRLQN